GKPLAVIPAGAQMDLTHIPNTFRVPAWDLLKDLSSAEFAVMHTDEWGTKYWVPNYQARIEREHALSLADARGLLIHDERLLSFMVNPAEDQYRNTITVGFSESWPSREPFGSQATGVSTRWWPERTSRSSYR